MNNKIIIGLGGCGVNFIHQITKLKDNNFDFAIVSEKAVVDISFIKNKIYLNSEVVENMKEFIKNNDEIFIVNGLGGKSCSYLKIILTELIKYNKNISVICTKPFKWEGKKREEIASNILLELELIDTNIKTYENDNM